MGTCSWSKVSTVAPSASPAQRRRDRGGRRADVGGDQRGGFVRAGGEHPQRLAERDGRLVGHPGQLAAADHGDDGQAGAGIEARHDGPEASGAAVAPARPALSFLSFGTEIGRIAT